GTLSESSAQAQTTRDDLPQDNTVRELKSFEMRFDPINFVARSIRRLSFVEGLPAPSLERPDCSRRRRRARQAKLLRARPPFRAASRAQRSTRSWPHWSRRTSSDCWRVAVRGWLRTSTWTTARY